MARRGILHFPLPFVVCNLLAQVLDVAPQSFALDSFLSFRVDLLMPFGEQGDYVGRNAFDFKAAAIVHDLITEPPEALGQIVVIAVFGELLSRSEEHTS